MEKGWPGRFGWLKAAAACALLVLMGVVLVLVVSPPAVISPVETSSRADAAAPAAGRPADQTPERALLPAGTPRRGAVAPPAWPHGGLRGRFVDRGGQPISGVTVSIQVLRREGWLLERQFGADLKERFPPQVSDAKGRFGWAAVPAVGRVALVPRARGFATLGLDWSMTTLHISPGIDNDCGDLVLLPEGRISGRVVDRRGQPIRGARIDVHDGPGPESPVLTDGEGRFSIGEFARTRFELSASADGFVALPAPFPRFYLSPGEHLQDVRITLDDPRFATGVVTDVDGSPLPGARVSTSVSYTGYTEIDPSTGQTSSGEAETDENGWFEVELPRAECRVGLAFRKDGFVTASRFIERPAGEDQIALGRIELRRLHRLRLLLLDPDSGEPQTPESIGAGFRVPEDQWKGGGYFKIDGERFKSSRLRDIEQLADGTVEGGVELLGEFFIRASVSGYLVENSHFFKTSGGDVTGPLIVILNPGAAVSGRVIDRGSRAPVRDTRIDVIPFDPPREPSVNRQPAKKVVRHVRTTFTDLRGDYRVTGLHPGAYRVRAVPIEQTPAESAPFELAPRGVFSLPVLEVGPAAAIEGIVLDREGLPVRAMPILAYRPDGRQQQAESDGNGRYRIAPLSPGTYRVRMQAERERSFYDWRSPAPHWPPPGQELRGERLVELSPGATETIDFHLEQTHLADVIGLVRVNGAPAEGLLVEIRRESNRYDGPSDGEVFTDHEGAYRLRAIPSGRCIVLVNRPREREEIVMRAIELEPAGAQRVDFDLQLTTLAVSVVERETGRPVMPASVSLEVLDPAAGEEDQWQQYRHFYAIEAGRVVFEQVLPGPYRLAVRDEADRFADAAEAVLVHPGSTTQVMIEMQRWGQLRIRTTGGRSLFLMELELLGDAGQRAVWLNLEQQADGTWLDRRVPPGTFELVAPGREEEIGRRSVTIVPGQEATISLDLSGD